MLDALSELASQGQARQGQGKIEREQREQQACQEEERKSQEIQASIAKEKAIPNAVQKTSDDGRYRVLSSGIIQDTKTGLEWLVGPDKDTTWDEAKAWVESIPSSRYGSGWRMPTRNELPTIYEKGKGKYNIDRVFVSPRDYLWVWSGETEGSSSAWCFDFHDGVEGWGNRSYSRVTRVFAVRAGRE